MCFTTNEKTSQDCTSYCYMLTFTTRLLCWKRPWISLWGVYPSINKHIITLRIKYYLIIIFNSHNKHKLCLWGTLTAQKTIQIVCLCPLAVDSDKPRGSTCNEMSNRSRQLSCATGRAVRGWYLISADYDSKSETLETPIQRSRQVSEASLKWSKIRTAQWGPY